MIDTGQEQFVLDSLKDIYGERGLDNYWQQLKKRYPGFTLEQLLKAVQADPICNNSFFGREANIRGLAWLVNRDINRNWQILDVGCGSGPEPYELAMRIVKDGGDNFAIDAFDVSEEAIKRAREGKFIYHPRYSTGSQRDFLAEMAKAGVLHKIKAIHTKTDFEELYEVDSKVFSKISFSTHDIIDAPFLPRGKQKYDLVICNTVLQHYPEWTRELILINLLEDVKEGGLLALEHNEFLGGLMMTPERAAWLKPYYEWKETLERFGLSQEEIKPEGSLLPLTVYRYNPSQNPFKGKRFGIRNRELAEIK